MHCNHCGTKESPDAKFCHNCGADLRKKTNNGTAQVTINSANSDDLNANVKVDITNKTTEKVLRGAGSGLSAIIVFLKKAIKPVIILSIIGLVIGTVIAGVVLYDEREQAKQAVKQALEQSEQVKQAMTFKKEKALGIFYIENMIMNNQFIYYGAAGKKYSDQLPNYDIYKRINGKIIISKDRFDIYIDENQDGSFADDDGGYEVKGGIFNSYVYGKSYDEIKTFDVQSISMSSNPEHYNMGIINSNSVGKILFEIVDSRFSPYKYRLHYSVGNDDYIFRLNKR